MVRIHPDPPTRARSAQRVKWNGGAIAQLGERLLCKQEVIGSIPIGSTSIVSSEDAAISVASAMLIGVSSLFEASNRLLFNNSGWKVKLFLFARARAGYCAAC
jgi:hypothetical protein